MTAGLLGVVQSHWMILASISSSSSRACPTQRPCQGLLSCQQTLAGEALRRLLDETNQARQQVDPTLVRVDANGPKDLTLEVYERDNELVRSYAADRLDPGVYQFYFDGHDEEGP